MGGPEWTCPVSFQSLSEHPGDDLPILTFGGKSAVVEFDMVHPSDMVVAYAADAIFSVVWSGTRSYFVNA